MEELQYNTMFIRMNSGEDIISEVAFTTDPSDQDVMILKNPLKVGYGISEQTGNIVVNLMYWVFPRLCDHQNFPVYSTDVVTVAQPSESMTKYYHTTIEKLNLFYSKGDKLSNYNVSDAMSNDEDVEELNDEDYTEEDLDYVKEMMEELKNKKRKLH